MSVVNLSAPVATQDVDVLRLQQRFEAAIQFLIATPWGDGTLVTGVALPAAAGNQTLKVRHGLGRVVKGALIGNCSSPVYGPWNVVTADNNNCNLTINLPSGAVAGGTIDLWVY